MKTKPKKVVYKKLAPEFKLVVEVAQNGFVQKRRIFKINSLFKKKIGFGKSRWVKFSFLNARIPNDVDLFYVGRHQVGVVLSQQLSGFVFTGQQHNSVEGFLGDKAATKQNLFLPLSENARGSFKIRDFEISFKLVKPARKKAAKKRRPAQGAGLAFFASAEPKTSFEKNAFWLAAGLGGLCLFGLYSGINASRSRASQGITDLSTELQFGIIHPMHYEMLPIVYRNEFQAENVNSQAVKWTRAFIDRANALEQGEGHKSAFDILNSGVGITSLAAQKNEWHSLQDKEFDLVLNRKRNELNSRYFKFIKRGFEFTTQTSGNFLGSIRLQQLRRIQQINRAYEVIKSRYMYEFETLNAAYEMYEVKFFDPSQKPKLGRIPEALLGKAAGIRYQDDFLVERENLASAKEFSRVAAKAGLRDELVLGLENEKKHSHTASVAWLSEDSLVTGVSTQSRRTVVDNLWKNAEMALDPSLVPTPVPSKAWIDMREVHRVIFTKREQVKACYDSALRRNPELAGKLNLGWVVAMNGKAKTVMTRENSLRDGAFVGCVKTRLQTWQFPKPKNGEVFITYPFEFDIAE